MLTRNSNTANDQMAFLITENQDVSVKKIDSSNFS